METTWGHSESIWKKTSTANKGGWMKRSLIINYMDNYKASYIRSVFSLIFDTLKKKFLYRSNMKMKNKRYHTLRTIRK
jgi:hypothetical protein